MAQRYETLERTRQRIADATNPSAPELARGVNTPTPVVDVLNAIHQPNYRRQTAMAETVRITGQTVRIDASDPRKYRLWPDYQKQLDNDLRKSVVIGLGGTITVIRRNGGSK